MQKIICKDISIDKHDLIYLISEMIEIYKMHKLHTQVLECNQWITMLNRKPIQNEFTPDTLICLKNILNDAVNYLIGVEDNWDDGELAMNLMNKIVELFNINKNEKN